MAMDARKQRILEAIVALYANDGEPVGSGLLANYFDMALSSATLRNEMAALTKLGLLEQPHTSAGRVPSAQGYRYYLDHLIDAPKSGTLPEKDRRRIDDLFAAMDAEPEKLVPAATRCLADMTGCAAAATTPQAPDLCIAHFEVVQVGRYSAAVLAVTSAGGVRTRVARVDTGLTRDDAANLAQLLNRGLTFVAPQDLSPMLMASMVLAAGQRLAPVIMAAQALVTTGPQACLEGAQYLAKMADVRQNLGTLLEIFSDNEAATELIRPESNYAVTQSGDTDDIQTPSAALNDALRASAKAAGIPLIEGNIHSSDVFYRQPSDEKPTYWEKLRDEKGCLAVEMESFALFHNARVLGKRAACLLTISDSFVSPEITTAEQRQTSFTAMMKVALGVDAFLEK